MAVYIASRSGVVVREHTNRDDQMTKNNYIIFRCDKDDCWIVSVEAPERGSHVYLGVAECPDKITAGAVFDALRLREELGHVN